MRRLVVHGVGRISLTLITIRLMHEGRAPSTPAIVHSMHRVEEPIKEA